MNDDEHVLRRIVQLCVRDAQATQDAPHVGEVLPVDSLEVQLPARKIGLRWAGNGEGQGH